MKRIITLLLLAAMLLSLCLILTLFAGCGAKESKTLKVAISPDFAPMEFVIYNEKDAENAYGFIGKSTTIAANSYKTISLRVKVSAGATANVYLIDMDDDTHASNLSIGSNVTYWYDDDGNVCAKDPAGEHFNAKKDIAFKLQSNGLYKVNTNWAGAEGVDTNAYFANLANYEKI